MSPSAAPPMEKTTAVSSSKTSCPYASTGVNSPSSNGTVSVQVFVIRLWYCYEYAYDVAGCYLVNTDILVLFTFNMRQIAHKTPQNTHCIHVMCCPCRPVGAVLWPVHQHHSGCQPCVAEQNHPHGRAGLLCANRRHDKHALQLLLQSTAQRQVGTTIRRHAR